MIALFVPRRRVWVKATAADGAVELEYAALARGEDPTLARAVDDLVAGHARLLDAAGGTTARAEDAEPETPSPASAAPADDETPEPDTRKVD
jgi:cytochrome c biogenesis protein